MKQHHRKILLYTTVCLWVAMSLLPGRAKAKQLITNPTGIIFVKINPGTFLMGSPTDEPGRQWDEKQHKVTISKGFYLSETEITQGQFFKVMAYNPSDFNKCGATCPVETVSWHECQAFIARLNQLEKTDKYRLPTEAEWEYACRAGSVTAFANGKITAEGCDPDPNLDKIAWYCGNSGLRKPVIYDIQPHRTKLKAPNNWGLYDMHGNVAEWCLDAGKPRSLIRTGVITTTYDQAEITDPLSETGPNRVFRGGSWKNSTRHLRSANRSSYKPGAKRNGIGFRVLKEL